MKRKLEDVAKRLESLYDLLRENKVSFAFEKISLKNSNFESSLTAIGQHLTIIESTSAINTNRRLRKLPRPAHSNDIRCRFLPNR